jgi:cell division protein FtsW (lipid II flippase)
LVYAEFAGERLLLTLWVGSLWAIGYLAVPLAFATIDTQIAAEYAATLFYAVNIIGLVSGTMMLLGKFFMERLQITRSWRFWLLLTMLALTLVFTVYIQPEIAAIKAIADWRADAALSGQFSDLHKLSENLYLMLSVLGLILVLTADKKAAADWSNGEK